MGQDSCLGPTVSANEGEIPSPASGAGSVQTPGEASSTGSTKPGEWIVWTKEWDVVAGEHWHPEIFRTHNLAVGFFQLCKKSGVEAKLTLVYYETEA